MNKYLKTLIFLFILLILSCPTNCQEISRTNLDAATVKMEYKYIDNRLMVKIQEAPPYENNPLKISYQIIKPFLKKELISATIDWQADIHSYGKSYSVGGVYIKDFLNGTVSEDEFLKFFKEKDILPVPFSKNGIKKVILEKVPDESALKAEEFKKQADIYFINKEYRSAIRIYKQATELNPSDYVSYFRLAQAYQMLNDNDNAAIYFEQAVKINPSFKAADNALYDIRKGKVTAGE